MYEWVRQALCTKSPDDGIWFGDMDLAKEICQQCPVMRQCLEYSMALEDGKSHHYRHGVYGGLGPKQRANLYKRLDKKDPEGSLREEIDRVIGAA